MQRYGISVRAGNALANSLLQDLGLANENNLLSRHKVSSMIEKHGGARAKEHAGQKNILCLKFDGRKDLTLTNDHQLIQEEHVVVMEEPGAKYIDHFTPSSSSAKDVEKELHDLISEYGSDQSVQVIGADGTSVNTGKRGGVI